MGPAAEARARGGQREVTGDKGQWALFCKGWDQLWLRLQNGGKGQFLSLWGRVSGGLWLVGQQRHDDGDRWGKGMDCLSVYTKEGYENESQGHHEVTTYRKIS
jgi:hypothetical protein